MNIACSNGNTPTHEAFKTNNLDVNQDFIRNLTILYFKNAFR